ncbi:hypothetical protein GCM10023349_14870 [Nocardioides conyzicola]|uniref:Transposase DDE domain-containing protein n=1 Tax=Nocardioides conyzicola TaxID=1651781 RepID=A0ABP8X3G5_9ACTN
MTSGPGAGLGWGASTGFAERARSNCRGYRHCDLDTRMGTDPKRTTSDRNLKFVLEGLLLAQPGTARPN